MILDALARFADSQVRTTSGASTDVLDLRNLKKLGIGEPMVICINVEAIDAGNGDETYQVQAQTDDADTFGSATSIGGALVIPRTAAVGSFWYLNIPPDGLMERYLRLNWTLGGTTPSITYSAYLLPLSFVQQAGTYYPDAITISG